MRTFGVEEELLLVNAESGVPRAVAGRVIRHAERLAEGSDTFGSLEQEMQAQQVEIDTDPTDDLHDLLVRLRERRRAAINAARQAGAKVVATGTSLLPVDPRVMPDERYRWMAERFGITASEHLTCGCHVHVSVASPEEAVAVIDRIRTDLSILVALSANSPYWKGKDSRYASFRTQAMSRWLTSGPQELFGSFATYEGLISRMLETGVIVDRGMVYFDVRISHRYPTVEIRVADVCLDVRDSVLIAALARALVETAARDWRAGAVPPAIPVSLVRFANWQASRYGVAGDLLDPRSLRPLPARDVVEGLLDRLTAALEASGDEAAVRERVATIFDRGTGADVQRAALAKTGQLPDVVAKLARITAGQDE